MYYLVSYCIFLGFGSSFSMNMNILRFVRLRSNSESLIQPMTLNCFLFFVLFCFVLFFGGITLHYSKYIFANKFISFALNMNQYKKKQKQKNKKKTIFYNKTLTDRISFGQLFSSTSSMYIVASWIILFL